MSKQHVQLQRILGHVAAMPCGLPCALPKWAEDAVLPQGDPSLSLRDFPVVQPLGAELHSRCILPESWFCKCLPKICCLCLCLLSFFRATGLSWAQGTEFRSPYVFPTAAQSCWTLSRMSRGLRLCMVWVQVSADSHLCIFSPSGGTRP